MPNNADSSLLASLRQSIEALALEVALRDLSSPERIQPLVPMLAQIRRQAESAGMTAVAEMASIAPDSEPALREALSRMQLLLAEPEPPAPPTSLNQDPELVGDFIMESREHLSAIEAQLLALEQDPRNTEAINTIFRGFHTIKGLAGFLEFLASVTPACLWAFAVAKERRLLTRSRGLLTSRWTQAFTPTMASFMDLPPFQKLNR